MGKKRYQRRKRRNRLLLILSLIACIALLIALMFLLVPLTLQIMEENDKLPFGTQNETEMLTGRAPEEEETAPGEEETQTEAPEEEGETEETENSRLITQVDLAEDEIYTFMQGPKAWAGKEPFSGAWCDVVLADQEFSVFGCGLCDLANIYSTLTPCVCSPLDMFYYAKEISRYTPVSGYGAIDWPYLRKTLTTCGIDTRLMRKEKTYEEFQQHIAESITSIVLVASHYDDTYWQDVEGHYVNIWIYDPEDDTVFLADSGNPSHNRQRIPLRYIYDALKVSSNFQYLRVVSVDPEGNTWGHDGIDIEWTSLEEARRIREAETETEPET